MQTEGNNFSIVQFLVKALTSSVREDKAFVDNFQLNKQHATCIRYSEQAVGEAHS